MTFLDASEFVFRFSSGAFNAATWIWVVIIFILFLGFFGSLWGKLWNREWSLMRHRGHFLVILALALGAAYSVFNLRSISAMDSWFTQQRTTLPGAVANSGRLKRSIIVETWNRLEPKQGQQELAPPDQSGDQVRLNTPEDAIVLATVAAEEARTALRSRPPFIFGTPLETKSPDTIATETIDALKVGAGAYPRTVGSENEWTATAATLQVNHALDTARTLLTPKLQELKTASLWLLGLWTLFAIVYGAVRAVEDIKINPKP